MGLLPSAHSPLLNMCVVPPTGKTLVTMGSWFIITDRQNERQKDRQTDRHHNLVAYSFLCLYKRAKAKNKNNERPQVLT